MLSNALEAPIAQPAEQTLLPEFSWVEIDSDPASWDKRVENRAHAMFSLSSVLRVHAHSRAQPMGILLPQADGGMLPIGALVRPKRGSRNLKTLAFPPLTETRDPELVKTLVAWLQSQGVSEIQIGSYTSGVEGYHLPGEGVEARQRLEFIWGLDASAEQRFRALRSNHRRKLQRLRQQPLTLRQLERFQPERLTQLRLQWGQRRELAFSWMQILEMYLHYRLLHRRLTRPGIGRLYGLYDQNSALLSLAYMLEVADTAFYMIGASSPAGYRMNASLRLFWDLAEHYQARGYQRLHFGGAPAEAVSEQHAEHGVLRFKAGFGIEPISRTTLSIKQ